MAAHALHAQVAADRLAVLGVQLCRSWGNAAGHPTITADLLYACASLSRPGSANLPLAYATVKWEAAQHDRLRLLELL